MGTPKTMNLLGYFWGKADNNEIDLSLAIHWFLRISCAMCFIGHGAWGVITKAGWLPFFAVVGIPENIAWYLMPVVGTFDIVMGISVLFRPTKIVLLWMSVWAVWTAMLRPLAGMGWWEFLERAGNYGPAIAFLVIGMATYQNLGWFQKIEAKPLPEDLLKKVIFIL